MTEVTTKYSPLGKKSVINSLPAVSNFGFQIPWKSLKSSIPAVKEQFGSPSFPSPLDRIRTGRCERAAQFGLTPLAKESYQQNQSFPNLCGSSQLDHRNDNQDMGDVSRKTTLDKFRGDALNSFSFSLGCSKGSFARTSDGFHPCRSLSGSWVFYNYVGGGQNGASFHSAVQNPNKAIITINARTTEILVANKMACHLLGLSTNMLSKRKLCEFFISRKGQYSLTEVEIEPSGELVLISGKVMDLVSVEKRVTPVSVWVRQLQAEDEPRCLVVMEPVERTTGVIVFTPKGQILSCDKNISSLHGYQCPHDLEGLSIRELIPSLVLPGEDEPKAQLPKEIRKQQATGRTKDGVSFPLSILIKPVYSVDESSDSDESTYDDCVSNLSYKGIVWVFANISGMITVLPDGTIHSCNTNFSLMLFGYPQDSLVGKSITTLIPGFYDDMEFLDTDSMALPPLDDEEEPEDDSHAQGGCASDGRTTADSLMTDPPRPANPMGKQIELMLEDATESVRGLNLCVSPRDLNYSPLKHDLSSFHELSFDGDRISPFKGTTYDAECARSVAPESAVASVSPPVNELCSESSSYCVLDSRKLSVSESQDTLHSSTNSITESDMNANILELVEDHEPYVCTDTKRRLSFCEDGAGDSVSFVSQVSETGRNVLISPLKNVPQANENCDISVYKTPTKPQSSHSTLSPKSGESVHLCNVTELISEQNAASSVENNSSTLSQHRDSNRTSTPKEATVLAACVTSPTSEDSVHSIPEGSFFGVGRHNDGSDLAIIYQTRKVELDDGKMLYCLWVARDPEEVGDGGRAYRSLTLASSFNTTLGQDYDSVQENLSGQNGSNVEPSDSDYTSGLFGDKYTVLQQIGKGAFGCVKMAYRNSDKLLVITKFIRKSEVYDECWVFDNKTQHRVPIEVSLLTNLQHPNIVRALDVFENKDYFQMVMEKHGAGMDLFEFIDRNPQLDEPLASYIFRQVVSALNFLHGLNILHRDIKDENIILDENFHVKLIDFGSAAFMSPGMLFSTFCGTMEYCSPEVLKGNKYHGPELEMWALGVTLYTLIFGENPFFDVDETIAAILNPPFKVSAALMSLIRGLLDSDPDRRFTLPEVSDHEWTNLAVFPENYKFGDVISASLEEKNPSKYYTDHLPVHSKSFVQEDMHTSLDAGGFNGIEHSFSAARLPNEEIADQDDDPEYYNVREEGFS